jgi:hypothetical protein
MESLDQHHFIEKMPLCRILSRKLENDRYPFITRWSLEFIATSPSSNLILGRIASGAQYTVKATVRSHLSVPRVT